MSRRTKHEKLVSGGKQLLSMEEIERQISVQRRRGWPRRDGLQLPISDMAFVHEKVLLRLNERDLTQNEIKKEFPDIPSVIDEIVEREVEKGHILRYKKAKQSYFKITDEGKRLLRFSQGMNALRYRH